MVPCALPLRATVWDASCCSEIKRRPCQGCHFFIHRDRFSEKWTSSMCSTQIVNIWLVTNCGAERSTSAASLAGFKDCHVVLKSPYSFLKKCLFLLVLPSVRRVFLSLTQWGWKSDSYKHSDRKRRSVQLSHSWRWNLRHICWEWTLQSATGSAASAFNF